MINILVPWCFLSLDVLLNLCCKVYRLHTYRCLAEIPNWPFVEVLKSTSVSHSSNTLSISLSMFLGSRLDCSLLLSPDPQALMQALPHALPPAHRPHPRLQPLPLSLEVSLLSWVPFWIRLFTGWTLILFHPHLNKRAPYCLSYCLSVPTVCQCQPVQLFLSNLCVIFNSTDCTLNWQDLSIWWDPSAHLLEHWIASSISNILYVSSPLLEYCFVCEYINNPSQLSW